MPLSRNRAFGDKPNSAPIRRMSSMACEAIRTSGLTRGWPSAVLIARALQRFFGLLPVGIGPAVGAERPDVEHREQVEAMQLGRKMKPSLSRVACQILWRRRTCVTARGLGRDTNAPLAGVALKQAEMWMFRRRTGHESLLCGLRRSSLPRF